MTTLREQIEALAEVYAEERELDSERVVSDLREALAEREVHRFNSAALSLADLAFMETPGSNAQRVKAAILGYLFALNSRQRFADGWVYPSLTDMREHLDELRAQAGAEAAARHRLIEEER